MTTAFWGIDQSLIDYTWSLLVRVSLVASLIVLTSIATDGLLRLVQARVSPIVLLCRSVLWSATMLSLLLTPVALQVVPNMSTAYSSLRLTSLGPRDSMPGNDNARFPLDRQRLTEPGSGLPMGQERTAPLSDGTLQSAVSEPPVPSAIQSAREGPASASWTSPLLRLRAALVGTLAYLIGTLIAAVRLVIGLVSVCGLRRNSTLLMEACWVKRHRHWCQKLRLTRTVPLVTSHAISVPMAVGLLRPSVMIPSSDIATKDVGYIDAILAHELAHIHRADLLSRLVARIVRAIYWYHPLIWIAERQLAAVSEQVCDQFASYAVGASRYVDVLLTFADRICTARQPAEGLAIMHGTRLGKRLSRIHLGPTISNCRASGQWRLFGAALMLIISLSICSALSIAQAPTEPNDIPDSPAAKTVENAFVDPFGDPLPAKAILRIGSVRFRQPYIWSISFSPDGHRVASAGHRLYTWDVKSGHRLHHIDDWFTSVCFHSDGRLLATSRFGLAVWPSAPNSSIRALGDSVIDTGFDPSADRMLVAYQSGNVSSIDLVSGRAETVIQRAERASGIERSVFSNDGRWLAQVFRNGIEIWNLSARQPVNKIDMRRLFRDTNIRFTPDDTFVLVGQRWSERITNRKTTSWHWRESVRAWDVQSGDEVLDFAAATVPLGAAFAFSADGSTVATLLDRQLVVSNFQQKRVLQRIPVTLSEVRPWRMAPISLSADGKLVAVGDWGLLRLWDIDSGEELHASGPATEPFHVTYSQPGDQLLTVDRNGTVRIWSARTGELVSAHFATGDQNRAIDWTSDERFLAQITRSTNTSSRVVVWDLLQGKRRATMQIPMAIQMAVLSEDAELVATVSTNNVASDTRKSTIRIWNAKDGTMLSQIHDLSCDVRTLLFSSDAETIAYVGTDNSSGAWDFRNQRRRNDKYEIPSTRPQARVVVARRDDAFEVRYSDLADPLASFPPSEAPSGAKLSLDRKLLVVEIGKGRHTEFSSGEVRWYDFERSRQGKIPRADGRIVSAALSPQGRRMATLTDVGTVLVWDLEEP